MALEQRTIVRCSKAAFSLGAAAIVCGIVALATFNAVLFQIYLAVTLVTLGGMIVLRWRAGRPLNNNWAMWGTILPITFLALSMMFFVPICGLVNVAALRTQSSRNLKQIALGSWDYQAKHGHLPAASISDSKGTPLLSWRVAILPFLDEEELYRQFNLDEPWDSPWNIGLLKRMPDVYHTPLQPGEMAPPHTTFYQVFVGPGTAFQPGAKLQIPRDFPDGAQNVILIVEAGNPVPWTKPEDLKYDPKGPVPALGAFRREKGRFPWRGGEGTGSVGLALCDGTVRLFSWPGVGLSEEILRKIIGRNDGPPPVVFW